MRESDEQQTKHFRTGSRFFCADGKWFYSTREGEVGPFNSREEAEEGLREFIDTQVLLHGGKVEFDAKPQSKAKRNEADSVWDNQVRII